MLTRSPLVRRGLRTKSKKSKRRSAKTWGSMYHRFLTGLVRGCPGALSLIVQRALRGGQGQGSSCCGYAEIVTPALATSQRLWVFESFGLFTGSKTLSPLCGRGEGVFMRRFMRTRIMRSRETPSPCPHRGSPNGETRQTVPPTVSPSIRKVGCPTPTGTLWPSLPQVPTPESSRMSLPIIEIFLSDSGPLPISVAPFTG